MSRDPNAADLALERGDAEALREVYRENASALRARVERRAGALRAEEVRRIMRGLCRFISNFSIPSNWPPSRFPTSTRSSLRARGAARPAS